MRVYPLRKFARGGRQTPYSLALGRDLRARLGAIFVYILHTSLCWRRRPGLQLCSPVPPATGTPVISVSGCCAHGVSSDWATPQRARFLVLPCHRQSLVQPTGQRPPRPTENTPARLHQAARPHNDSAGLSNIEQQRAPHRETMRREKMGEKTKTRKDGGRRSRGRGRGRGRRRRRAISKRESTPKGATPRAGAKDHSSGSGPQNKGKALKKIKKTMLAVPGLDPGTSGIFFPLRGAQDTLNISHFRQNSATERGVSPVAWCWSE